MNKLVKQFRWDDGCEHGEAAYVGSFSCISETSHQCYDVYLDGKDVCIRYGDEPSEYISPGNLEHFAARLNGPGPIDVTTRKRVDWPGHYKRAFRMIQHHIATDLAEQCRARARLSNDSLFADLANFISLFAIDSRDI